METWKIIYLSIIAMMSFLFLILCFSMRKVIKDSVGVEISEINVKLKKLLGIIKTIIVLIILITVANIGYIILNGLL